MCGLGTSWKGVATGTSIKRKPPGLKGIITDRDIKLPLGGEMGYPNLAT
jgi:hypothetical protein